MKQQTVFNVFLLYFNNYLIYIKIKHGDIKEEKDEK